MSNLAFTLEKVESARLTDHLEHNSLMDYLQSAYRVRYSTETVLLKVQNDALQAFDNGSAATLIMLDLLHLTPLTT